MKWFKDLMIKTKLISGFAVVIVLMITLAVIATESLKSTDTGYSYLLDSVQIRLQSMLRAEKQVTEIRRLTAIIAVNSGDVEHINENKALQDTAYTELNSIIQRYIDSVNNDVKLDAAGKSDRLSMMANVQNSLKQYKSDIADKVIVYALAGDEKGAKDTIDAGAQIATSLVTDVGYLETQAQQLSDTSSANQTTTVNNTIILFIVIAVISVILAIIVAMFIAGVITRPIVELVHVAENVAGGNLNVNIRSDSKDEVGQLTKGFSEVIANIRNIITDIDTMYNEHENGEMDNRINDAPYKGAYKDVTKGINTMVNSYILMLEDIFRVLKAFGQGSFDVEVQKYKGQKAVVNTEVDTLKNTINSVVKEIDDLAKAGAEGNLSDRADTDKYHGQWAQILTGLNNVLIAVANPIHESESVIIELSKGNFDKYMQGDYKGDFNEIKQALNGTVSAISSYIQEINEILGLISKGDLRSSIKREYIGEFSSIKESINTINSVLHNTMSEISSGSDQLLAGAGQISDSAMTLAQGATEQASSVQELTASMDTINEQTRDNASNADKANTLSAKSMQNAQQGNKEMESMLESMNGIKEASNSISKIIKVIEDIAFQTNLLALNAAVEAARAGEHGKGFAVVAEEVRNLASRSQDAAKETTGLIGDSIFKVNEGTKIAQATASALNIIVENATEVSNIISEILRSSNEQAGSISEISIGLNQISQVIQNNSSTSEESAAASEELNSQAEMLKKMVMFFQL